MSKEIILASIVALIVFGGIHLILEKHAELRRLLNENTNQDHHAPNEDKNG